MDATSVTVAAIGALPGLLAAVYAHGARRGARHAQQSAQHAVQAIGPRDGETISELLHRITEFEQYQHERNHDLLNLLQQVVLQLDLIRRLLGDVPPARPPKR